MATARLISFAENDGRKLSLYELSMPVLDIAGDETSIVMVSQLPASDGRETAVLPVFPCPLHTLHESLFTADMQIDMLMDKCSDNEALERLGYHVA